MLSRRTVLMLGLAIFVVFYAALLPKPEQSAVRSPEASQAVLSGPEPTAEPFVPSPPALRGGAARLTPAEEEVARLEAELYRQYPLAERFRHDTEDRKSIEADMAQRMKAFMEEPSDVRTRNLRSGNLNIFIQVEAPLIMKEMLVSGSDYGQMLRATFKARQWDWPHMLRNLDSRIDYSAPERPALETPEQFIEAIQQREERIRTYCESIQKEASMPDTVRADVREVTLNLARNGVVKAYLETVTPVELTEARKRVAQEAKERMN